MTRPILSITISATLLAALGAPAMADKLVSWSEGSKAPKTSLRFSPTSNEAYSESMTVSADLGDGRSAWVTLALTNLGWGDGKAATSSAVGWDGTKVKGKQDVGKGWSQKVLAQRAGVFDVGELERGRKVKGGNVNPRLETLCKLAAALGVEVGELFGQPALDGDLSAIADLLGPRSQDAKRRAVKLIEALVSPDG